MSEKSVRKIFIVILIFLPLQYIMVGILGYYKAEPWPAFVFPGFKNVYAYEGHYELQQTHFELYSEDGEEIVSLKSYQFLQDLPRSQISGFMRVNFQDENSIQNLSQEAITWLKDNSDRVAGRNVDHIKISYSLNYFRQNGEGLSFDSTDIQFQSVIQFNSH